MLNQVDGQGRNVHVLSVADVGPQDDPAKQVVIRAESPENGSYLFHGPPAAGCLGCCGCS